MSRSVLRAVGCVLLLAAAGIGVVGAPAGAATLDDAGWWYRFHPAPPPPGVPEDGLLVEGSPEGPIAVAALRYTLSDGETNPVLELTVASRGGGGEGEAPPPTAPALPGAPVPPEAPTPADPVVLACAAAAPWAGAQGGPFAEAPKPDCAAGSVTGQAAEDGSTYTFPIGPLQRGTTVDVVLVPGTVEGAPEGAAGSTFELAFAAPGDGSLQTTAGTAPAGGFPSASTFSPSADGASGGSFAPSGGSSFDAPATGVPDVGAEGGSGEAPAGGAPEVVEPAGEPAPATDPPDPRGVAMALLAAGAALAFWAGQRRPRPVRALSRFARPPAGAAT